MSSRFSFSGRDTPSPAAQFRRRGGAELELLFELSIITLILALVPPIWRLGGQFHHRGGHSRTHCVNKLRNISLALHNYNNTYGGLPPAYTVDADGKPLHSWRTLILPWLDQQALYDKIDLSKPWDDPANAEAAASAVPAYLCPSADLEPNQTVYLAVTTSDSCLRPMKSLSIAEITDGTSNTILVIEVPVKSAVPWMAPRDADLFLALSSKPDDDLHHTGGYFAGFADGSVKFLSSKTDPSTLRSLTTAARGDVVGQY